MLDDLRSQIHENPELDAVQLPTFVVNSAEDAHSAISNIIERFGADPNLPVVRILLESRTVGYLERSDIDVYLAAGAKGFGDSAGATIPGVPPAGRMREFKFRCPISGCPQSPVYVLTFTSTPRCHLHHVELQLANEPE
jgi:hypothetical protein